MIGNIILLGLTSLALAGEPDVFGNYFDDSIKEVDISLDVAIKACLQNGNTFADKVKAAYTKCFGEAYDFDDLAADSDSKDSDNDGLSDKFEGNEACFYKEMGWVAGSTVKDEVIKADLVGLEESLKTEFDGNIDKCASWSGSFGTRRKREAEETKTGGDVPSVMEKGKAALGWLKSAVRKTRSADPQKGKGDGKGKGKGKGGRPRNQNKKRKGKGKGKGKNPKPNKRNSKGKGKGKPKSRNNKKKGGRPKKRNGKKKSGNVKGKGRGNKPKRRNNKKNGGKPKGRNNKKKGGNSKKRNGKGKGNGKAKGKGKGKGNRRDGKPKRRNNKKNNKGKGKGKGKENENEKGGNRNASKKNGKVEKEGKGKGGKGKGKGKGGNGQNKPSSRNKGMEESTYNKLWCFDLSLEQVLEKCVEEKIKN